MSDTENPPKEDPKPKGDQVSREAYEKALAEKGNLKKAMDEKDAKIAAFEAKLKESEEQKLREKEDFKALAESKEKESLDWQTKHTALSTKLERGVKLSAFRKEVEKLGVKDTKAVDALFNLAQLDKMKYDSEHEVVTGVEDEVKRIHEIFPAAFGKVDPKGNHDAGDNRAPAKMSIEAWKALSPAERNKIPLKDVYAGAGHDIVKKP